VTPDVGSEGRVPSATEGIARACSVRAVERLAARRWEEGVWSAGCGCRDPLDPDMQGRVPEVAVGAGGVRRQGHANRDARY
jgi:hypothetical protein